MPKATVAIEDRRFYQHGGVDSDGHRARALKDLGAGKVVEGGSTITQQLVRNLYIDSEQTLERKIEGGLPCDQARATLVEGEDPNGVHEPGLLRQPRLRHQAAAQTYFSSRAKKLTLAQAALLAGLPQAPSIYDPFTGPPRRSPA